MSYRANLLAEKEYICCLSFILSAVSTCSSIGLYLNKKIAKTSIGIVAGTLLNYYIAASFEFLVPEISITRKYVIVNDCANVCAVLRSDTVINSKLII